MEIRKLVEKKNHWGFLAGSDALNFLRYVRAAGTWTDATYEQLTNFMLGLPVKNGYRFQVFAGLPIQQLEPSPVQQTVAQRFRARSAKKASRQQRWRQGKVRLQWTTIQ